MPDRSGPDRVLFGPPCFISPPPPPLPPNPPFPLPSPSSHQPSTFYHSFPHSLPLTHRREEGGITQSHNTFRIQIGS